MTEIIFIVEDSAEGGFTARALGEAIHTQAEDMETLRANIREAALLHFDEGKAPKLIRLHFVREELIPL